MNQIKHYVHKLCMYFKLAASCEGHGRVIFLVMISACCHADLITFSVSN